MDKAKENIEFSIIIPVQKINHYIYETCEKLGRQNNRNFEILIFPDELDEESKNEEKKLGARIIPTGAVSPAIKRDYALKYAKGKYFAFTDDDAYPDENWLEIAGQCLKDENVAAVGGPQLTPKEDSFWQKVSGAMFLSPLSGSAIIRYWPGKRICDIDDWPTVNFIVKREDFEKLGGFDSKYWPGEDTKLCLDIVEKLKKKILYIPNMIVFHHRRSGLKKHLKQVGNYGLHRGFFAKAFPQTSMKLLSFYYVPTLFVLFLLLGIVFSIFSNNVLRLFLLGLGIYFSAVIVSTLLIVPKTKSFLISFATVPYLVLFHIWYGIRFAQGYIFTKELNSKLGK